MKHLRKTIFALLIISVLFLGDSCATLQKVSDAMINLKRLKFKLENVNNFNLAGVDLSRKNSISDFNVTDGINLTRAYAAKSLPANFVLNIAAVNPNDGTGGSRQSSATLTRMDWQLYIDDNPTVSGVMNQSFTIPGTGQSVVIPLGISLDLYKFFQDRSYDNILNLALAIGGFNSQPSRLKVYAKPTISTPFGDMVYPDRILIVDKSFTN